MRQGPRPQIRRKCSPGARARRCVADQQPLLPPTCLMRQCDRQLNARLQAAGWRTYVHAMAAPSPADPRLTLPTAAPCDLIGMALFQAAPPFFPPKQPASLLFRTCPSPSFCSLFCLFARCCWLFSFHLCCVPRPSSQLPCYPNHSATPFSISWHCTAESV